MKVGQIISLLRGILKEHSDDSKFTPEEIYAAFSIAASELISQKLRRFNYIDDHNRHTFCIGLEKGLSHECGCITVGCSVLKSVNKIPKYVSGRNTSTLKVLTLEGIVVDRIDEEDLDIIETNDIINNDIFYSIVNQRIVLWNIDTLPKNLKAIQVSAIWENVTDWADIQYCQENNNDPEAPDCVDILEQEVSIDNDQIRIAIMRALELLGLKQRLTEDLTNDAQGEIRV